MVSPARTLSPVLTVRWKGPPLSSTVLIPRCRRISSPESILKATACPVSATMTTSASAGASTSPIKGLIPKPSPITFEEKTGSGTSGNSITSPVRGETIGMPEAGVSDMRLLSKPSAVRLCVLRVVDCAAFKAARGRGPGQGPRTHRVRRPLLACAALLAWRGRLAVRVGSPSPHMGSLIRPFCVRSPSGLLAERVCVYKNRQRLVRAQGQRRFDVVRRTEFRRRMRTGHRVAIGPRAWRRMRTEPRFNAV